MVKFDSSESPSWQFASALELLESPADKGASARSSCHPESLIDVQDHQDQRNKDVSYRAINQAVSLASKRSHANLGDFHHLWDLLDSSMPNIPTSKPDDAHLATQPSSAFSILERPVKSRTGYDSLDNTDHDTDHNATEYAQPASKASPGDDQSNSETLPDARGRSSKRPPQPTTILKRELVDKSTSADTKADSDVLRARPRAIVGAGTLNTPRRNPQPRSSRNETPIRVSNAAYSSEASAGAESDSSFIFDRPNHRRFGDLPFVPSQIGTLDAQATRYDTPPSSFEDQGISLNANTIAALAPGGRALASLYKSSTERRVALTTKLLNQFPEYTNLVVSAGQSPIGFSGSSKSIHIIVDISNILVGFYDTVKLSRNIPLETRIRRLHMSFANLALIMERGRHVAKKVLVGSDRLPYLDEAERLGYEINILDRVQKFKHHTPRHNNRPRNLSGSNSHGAGGPETVASSKRQFREQGVDELLHLKMLESVLDSEPATIVLATGDAAVAEFSGGFMVMAERALERGWSIELVSFTQVTSYAYRKKEFRAKWGDQFKIVELDPYIEELFD
ncbi:uncharacterized protein N7511_002120 [Penicillium nucicola]|uniref:uncharacterized protein n=1 Tax=Penicillium nucicola TaxID=1850975 RepID=UPI002545A49C|nr:uncharacterized protein N7511_002120 [Penicillium nucicola]KAJ5770069.1 hypothetical protein N7511_002120 [Penicillium nucicola]